MFFSFISKNKTLLVLVLLTLINMLLFTYSGSGNDLNNEPKYNQSSSGFLPNNDLQKETTPTKIQVTFNKSFQDIYEGKNVCSDVMEFLKVVCSRQPDITELFSAGQSYEGRELEVLKIGLGAKKIFINAEHHPREYITTIVVLNQIQEIIDAYEESNKLGGVDVKSLLNEVTFYFMPLVNPDGVEICTGGKPEWYLNARGVNLNRNYDAEWVKDPSDNGLGSSGEYPFSEPETKALKDLCERELFDASVSYHAAGEIIYWYFTQKSGDLKRDSRLADMLGRMTGYHPMTIKQSIGGSERWGGFKDWFIDKMHKPGFTVEMGKGSIDRPIPFREYQSIWGKNRYLPVKLGAEILNIK